MRRKKRTFSETEEINTEAPVESTSDSHKSKSKAAVADDQPETVAADSEEIVKLKLMHEKLAASSSSRLKRKKQPVSSNKTDIADKAVDVSMLDAITSDHDSNEESDEDEDEDDDDTPGWKIDVHKSNSRKM